MSIRISEEHGLNPSIPVCFWCGEKKNNILLLGKLAGDKEAPISAVYDYEPCDKCNEIFSQGLLFIEISEHPMKEGLVKMGGQGYPTSRHLVMTEEATRRLLEESPIVDDIIKFGKTLVDKKLFDMLTS